MAISMAMPHLASALDQEQAHAITTNLCYAFEFRQQHRLHMRDPEPISEAILITYRWNEDQRLREAFKEWHRLDLAAYKALIGPGATFVTARSSLSVALLGSYGFQKAAMECSDRVGVDITEDLRAEIVRNDLLKSGSISVLAGVGIFKVGQQFFGKLIKAGYIKPLSETAMRWLRRSLITVGIAAPASVILLKYLEFHENNAQKTEVVIGNSKERVLWEEWRERRELMVSVLSDLKQISENAKKTGHLNCASPMPCDRLLKTIALVGSEKDELIRLKLKTESELADHRSQEDSQVISEKKQFIIASTIVLDLIAIR